MNRFTSVVAMVAVASVLAACDRGATSPKGAINATFELKSINGASLPYTRSLGTAMMRITSDILVLSDDGSYVDSTTYAMPYAQSLQVGTTIERGKYSVSDGAISFTSQSNGSRYGGTISGSTLTQSANGLTAGYERR